jgi:hypothetical protein
MQQAIQSPCGSHLPLTNGAGGKKKGPNKQTNKHKSNMKETLPPTNRCPFEPPQSCVGVYVHVCACVCETLLPSLYLSLSPVVVLWFISPASAEGATLSKKPLPAATHQRSLFFRSRNWAMRWSTSGAALLLTR